MNYPRPQWERIMRIQDVFAKAGHDKITWKEASEILGVSDRTVRRWKQIVEQNGYEGLLDQRTKRPSPKRAPETVREQVLKLYRDTYRDWNVKHFHEQLVQYGITLKYTWVKNLLQGASYVQVRRRRSKHRLRRERKPMIGMMLHIDGSDHVWIPDLATQRQSLILIADDANNDIYYAKLVPEETTQECMLGLYQVVLKRGLFCSLYSDRAGHFFYTPKGKTKVALDNLTQIGRALYELGIEPIPAYSPQARGRSERFNRTWQDRLPKELKLHRIKTIPDANRYILETFLPLYRENFLKMPVQKASAFTPYRGKNLNLVFSVKEQRTVAPDNTIHWNNLVLQIQPSKFRCSFAKCKVTVHEHLDGTLSVVYGPHTIGRFNSNGISLTKPSKPKPIKQLIAFT
jgi:transposase